ncbi:hypothetical protein HGB25_00490 [Candidatus Saccharibacteria bacterium]|nr:hypothetical protein [Candidatus Saccharibacteria bacterium]
MTKIINKLAASLVLFSLLSGIFVSLSSPLTVSAVADDCNTGFLGFPSWYRGLTSPAPDCAIVSPSTLNTAPAGEADNGLSIFIWHIVLNILEAAIVAIAYISAGFELYGGFLFITSRGKPEGAAKARQTMLDAIIGLIISLMAIGIVQFVINGILK